MGVRVIVRLLCSFLLLFFISGCACLFGDCPMKQQQATQVGQPPCHTDKPPCFMEKGTPQADNRKDILYTCNCGPQCKCNSVGTQSGNCTCGSPMKWGHVIKVEGDEALLCTCGKGCQCGADAKDPEKCGCGNPMKRVSLKGTGLYFCNCGGSCFSNTISVEPGSCRCGMDLKKIE